MSQKVDAHEARALEEALKETPVKGKDRRRAWALLRESGLDAALDFLNTAQQVTQLQSAVPYRVWGREHIDNQALLQMDNAARLPIAVAGALMPDAHLGYGLPIGGVLATDNAVIPYAVGVDIACRMRLTVFDVDEQALTTSRELLKESLMSQTRFGAGAKFEKGDLSEHDVLDRPEWRATPMLRDLYDTAIPQLGTSGGGNHFVEWGLFTLDAPDERLGVHKPGTYLALLSHSGSRGVGFKIANHYSKLAMAQHPGLPKEVQHLAWFTLGSAEGEEYWLSMELAGAFAAANHAVIHQRIAAATGFDALATVEKSSQFRLARGSRWQGSRRPPQGRNPGGQRRAGGHPRLDGRPRLCRARHRQRRIGQFGLARRGPQDEPSRGQEVDQPQRPERLPARTRGRTARRRPGRSPAGVQIHRGSHGGPGRPGADRRALPAQNRPHGPRLTPPRPAGIMTLHNLHNRL